MTRQAKSQKNRASPSRRTGPSFASAPRMPAGYRSLSCASSRSTCVVAGSNMAVCTWNAAAAATRSLWLFPVSDGDFVHLVWAAAWPTPPCTSNRTFFPPSPSVTGSARCHGACARCADTTACCAPLCFMATHLTVPRWSAPSCLSSAARSRGEPSAGLVSTVLPTLTPARWQRFREPTRLCD